MRTIKFRAKTIEGEIPGEWIHGDLLQGDSFSGPKIRRIIPPGADIATDVDPIPSVSIQA